MPLLVMLVSAYTAAGERKPKTPPLHVYNDSDDRTLCGLVLPATAPGWYGCGLPLDDPAFPFGPICPKCRKAAK